MGELINNGHAVDSSLVGAICAWQCLRMSVFVIYELFDLYILYPVLLSLDTFWRYGLKLSSPNVVFLVKDLGDGFYDALQTRGVIRAGIYLLSR